MASVYGVALALALALGVGVGQVAAQGQQGTGYGYPYGPMGAAPASVSAPPPRAPETIFVGPGGPTKTEGGSNTIDLATPLNAARDQVIAAIQASSSAIFTMLALVAGVGLVMKLIDRVTGGR